MKVWCLIFHIWSVFPNFLYLTEFAIASWCYRLFWSKHSFPMQTINFGNQEAGLLFIILISWILHLVLHVSVQLHAPSSKLDSIPRKRTKFHILISNGNYLQQTKLPNKIPKLTKRVRMLLIFGKTRFTFCAVYYNYCDADASKNYPANFRMHYSLCHDFGNK